MAPSRVRLAQIIDPSARIQIVNEILAGHVVGSISALLMRGTAGDGVQMLGIEDAELAMSASSASLESNAAASMIAGASTGFEERAGMSLPVATTMPPGF